MKRNEVWSEFVGQNFLVEWELPPSKSVQIGKKVNQKFRGGPGGRSWCQILIFCSPFIRVHKFENLWYSAFCTRELRYRKIWIFFIIFFLHQICFPCQLVWKRWNIAKEYAFTSLDCLVKVIFNYFVAYIHASYVHIFIVAGETCCILWPLFLFFVIFKRYWFVVWQ